jgi:hypothetical protein
LTDDPPPDPPLRPAPFPPRAPRTVTLLITGKLVTRAEEGLCRVRNISATGMQIETRIPLAVGDAVGVELRGLSAIAGKVVWSRGSLAGIASDGAIDVERLLHPAPVSRLVRAPHPRGPRVLVELAIEVQDGDGIHEAALIDLSQGGARVRLPFRPRIEERLSLIVTGLPLKSGAVRWIRGDEAGIAFYEPLSFDCLAEWLVDRGRSGAPAAAAR